MKYEKSSDRLAQSYLTYKDVTNQQSSHLAIIICQSLDHHKRRDYSPLCLVHGFTLNVAGRVTNSKLCCRKAVM